MSMLILTWAKTFLILYPPSENSTTRIALMYVSIERSCLSLYVYCELLLKANIDNSTHYDQNSFLYRRTEKNCENSPAPLALLQKHKERTKCFSTRKKGTQSSK